MRADSRCRLRRLLTQTLNTPKATDEGGPVERPAVPEKDVVCKTILPVNPQICKPILAMGSACLVTNLLAS